MKFDQPVKYSWHNEEGWTTSTMRMSTVLGMRKNVRGQIGTRRLEKNIVT